MKISISGKGGSGKTTTAGTLARILARRGHRVLAIDGDSNPNLGLMLGIPLDEIDELPILPGDLLQETTDEYGQRTTTLATSLEDIVAHYGTPAADGVRLLAMKRIDHAGKG